MASLKPPVINVSVLFTQLDEGIQKATRPIATKLAEDKFEDSKEEFLTAFLDNPISKELEDSKNNTPSEIIQYGSLFGFIGFPEGSDPIGELYKYLNENITFNKNGTYDRQNKSYSFNVSIPTKEEIAAETHMPWNTARSWVFAIEQGISGLNNYLYIQKYGRSKEGIQIKGKKSGTQFIAQKYMSDLLKFLNTVLKGPL